MKKLVLLLNQEIILVHIFRQLSQQSRMQLLATAKALHNVEKRHRNNKTKEAHL